MVGAAHIPRGRNRDRPIPASRKMRRSLYRSKFQGNWERIFRAAAGFLLSDDVTRVFQTLRPAHILPGRDRHRISGWYALFLGAATGLHKHRTVLPSQFLDGSARLSAAERANG